jgi:hypothetical protein
MKTKILFLLALLPVLVSGQINPVNNLSYQQFYDFGNSNCPAYNCFVLSWQSPDTTNDTLIGYRVYRNGQYYTFTNNLAISCAGAGPCNYNDWYSLLPFWATVKAVYNHDSVGSEVNDSVEVSDLAIYINEHDQQAFSLLKNPVKTGENISLLIPNSASDKLIVKLLSPNGQTLKSYEFLNAYKSIIYLPSTGLVKGLFFMNIETGERKLILKLLID